MKKKLVFEYEWINETNPSLPIPSHHETKLMGHTEWHMPMQRRGGRTSGTMSFTYVEKGGETPYKGMWSCKYEYE